MENRRLVGRRLGSLTESLAELPNDQPRSMLPAAAWLLLFAIGASATGFGLATAERCTNLCARAAVLLYAAGTPVSGLFSALAGGLPLAWPLDITLWVVIGIATSRLARWRRIPVWRMILAVIAVALIYGWGLSGLVELT